MKTPNARYVSYDHPELGRIGVRRLTPADIGEYAVPMLIALHQGYSAAHADRLSDKGAAALRDMFDPTNPEVVARQTKTMAEYMKRGSRYWVARPGIRSLDDSVAIAKITPVRPGRAQRARLSPPDARLDIIATPPNHRRKGVATLMADAALAASGFDSRTKLSLYAFIGDMPATTMVKDWGLERQSANRAELFEVTNKESLPAARYATPDGLDLGGIRQNMRSGDSPRAEWLDTIEVDGMEDSALVAAMEARERRTAIMYLGEHAMGPAGGIVGGVEVSFEPAEQTA